MNNVGSKLLVAALFCLTAWTATPARAELKSELATVATQVATYLKANGTDDVAMGEFKAPAGFATNAGPGIAKMLVDALGKQEIEVKKRSQNSIRGQYIYADNEENGRSMAKIKGELVHFTGRVVYSFEKDVEDPETVAQLFGLTVELPADKSKNERDKVLKDALFVGKPEIKQASIKTVKDSDYGIEIHIKEGSSYVPREAVDDEGLAFVKINRDEVYAIKLINNSNYDAAVKINIDGISLFSFADQEYPYLILKRNSDALVKGWYINNQLSKEFKVTEYAQSAVAELLPSSTKVGLITVSFAAAWKSDEPAPEDELSAQLASRSIGDATGVGEDVKENRGFLVRETGEVRSVISVRYVKDSTPENLPPTDAP